MFAKSKTSSTYPSLNPPTLNEILGKNTALVENPPMQRRLYDDDKPEEANKRDIFLENSEAGGATEDQAKTFVESVKHFEDGDNESAQGEKEGKDIIQEISKAVSDTKFNKAGDEDTAEGKNVIENMINTLHRGE